MHASIRPGVAIPSRGKRRRPSLPQSTTTKTTATASSSPPPAHGKGRERGRRYPWSSPLQTVPTIASPSEPAAGGSHGAHSNALSCRLGRGGSQEESEVPGSVSGGKLCSVLAAGGFGWVGEGGGSGAVGPAPAATLSPARRAQAVRS